MQALLEIAPVAAFFAAYYLAGSIYVATAVLMVPVAMGRIELPPRQDWARLALLAASLELEKTDPNPLI